MLRICSSLQVPFFLSPEVTTVLLQGLRVKPLDDHVDGVKEPSFSRFVFGGGKVHPEF